jgi:hypothetical protein
MRRPYQQNKHWRTAEPVAEKPARIMDAIDVEYRNRCVVLHIAEPFQRIVYGLTASEYNARFSMDNRVCYDCRDTFDPSDIAPKSAPIPRQRG